MADHLNTRLNKMKFKSQLQTHTLHDLDKPIKIPKTKLFLGIELIKLMRNLKSQTG